MYARGVELLYPILRRAAPFRTNAGAMSSRGTVHLRAGTIASHPKLHRSDTREIVRCRSQLVASALGLIFRVDIKIVRALVAVPFCDISSADHQNRSGARQVR